MIPLIPFLTDTVIAYDEPAYMNIVHEWGVVVFQQDVPPVCGVPWSETAFMDETCAEAPVIWIHGQPFTGSLQVTLPADGSFTFLYPEPSDMEEGKAKWVFSAGIPLPQEESLPAVERSIYTGPFQWALPYWRMVPSLPLQFASGLEENFLYYECTVREGFTDNFFTWGSHGNPVFPAESVSEALYFSPSGVFPVEPDAGEFMPVDLPIAGETNPEFAEETFCRWGGSRFKTEEIHALWETWRPELTGEDSYWLVFPIPAEYHDEISSLVLTTGTDGTAVCERLFLGAVRLNRM